MKQLTTLQELIERLKNLQKNGYDDGGIRTAIDISNELLERERQIVVDAVNDTYNSVIGIETGYMPTPIDGEDYYNNKYSK